MGRGNKAKKKKKEVEGNYNDDDVSIVAHYRNKEVLTSGNPEIDKKMGGGIPIGSLTLIEGPNDSGKSVLTQQLLWGAAQQGFHIAVYTTENTIKTLLKQMDSLALNVTDFFLLGHLKIFPLSVERAECADVNLLSTIVSTVVETKIEVVIIDSLTVLTSHSSDSDILNFFTTCKNMCDSGKTFLMIIHDYAVGLNMLSRLRSMCDAHITLRLDKSDLRLVKAMEIMKIRGAQLTTGNILHFEVEPEFGLRIIPVLRARV